jgi:hypothetical protein
MERQPLRLLNPVEAALDKVQPPYTTDDMVAEINELNRRLRAKEPVSEQEENWLIWAEQKLDKWSDIWDQ